MYYVKSKQLRKMKKFENQLLGVWGNLPNMAQLLIATLSLTIAICAIGQVASHVEKAKVRKEVICLGQY